MKNLFIAILVAFLVIAPGLQSRAGVPTMQVMETGTNGSFFYQSVQSVQVLSGTNVAGNLPAASPITVYYSVASSGTTGAIYVKTTGTGTAGWLQVSGTGGQ